MIIRQHVPSTLVDPPHEMRHPERTQDMCRRLSEGETLPPVFAYREGQRWRAVSGSHRVAAYRQLGMPVPVIVLDPEVVARARRRSHQLDPASTNFNILMLSLIGLVGPDIEAEILRQEHPPRDPDAERRWPVRDSIVIPRASVTGG